MLRIESLQVSHGQTPVLHGVSMSVEAGRIHCLMGRNGAGKTTLLHSIMGLLPIQAGHLQLDQTNITSRPPHERPELGVALVPQGRRLFADLTVKENLELALNAVSDRSGLAAALEHFPRLSERMNQRAGTLSGGEQQMLATARALCIRPRVLLLDEPTEGLQPSMIEVIRSSVSALAAQGVAVLLVEQRAEAVLDIADQASLLENGNLRETLPAATLRAEPERLNGWLGVGVR